MAVMTPGTRDAWELPPKVIDVRPAVVDSPLGSG
jgi:hypothetical protein